MHAKGLKAHLDGQPNGHRGYVQGDLPPVQEQLGEHRWLGLTMSPSVAALFHAHQHAVPLFKMNADVKGRGKKAGRSRAEAAVLDVCGVELGPELVEAGAPARVRAF
jgi:hypothetical protein